MPEMWKLFIPSGESILTVVPGRRDGRDRVFWLMYKTNGYGKEGL